MRLLFITLFAVAAGLGCSASGSDATGAGGTSGATTASSAGSGGASASSTTDAASSTTGGGGAPSPWACVGSVDWPPAQATSIVIDLTLKDGFTMTPLSGVTVKVCKGDDPPCATPITSGTSMPDGRFSTGINIDAGGFDGYLDFTGPTIQPQIAYLGPPPLVKEYKSLGFFLVSKNDFGSIHTAAGVMPDPARGAVRARAVDCHNVNAAGVHVGALEADAATKTIYFKGPNPSASATETDDGGFAALLNLPPGDDLLTADLVAEQKAFAQLPVIVRAGTLTLTPLPPTPLP